MVGEADARLTHKEEGEPGFRTAPPEGGCPEPLRRTEAESPSVGAKATWARDWLRAVAEARVALERARALVEMRRERALGIGNPMGGGPSGRGGTNATEANMIGYVASEDDLATTYAWAHAELAAFDAMARANRQVLRGAILDGLDVAEMKYRIGASDREIAKAFGISRSKLHVDLAAFVDYLDFIGKERALYPTTDDVR